MLVRKTKYFFRFTDIDFKNNFFAFFFMSYCEFDIPNIPPLTPYTHSYPTIHKIFILHIQYMLYNKITKITFLKYRNH